MSHADCSRWSHRIGGNRLRIAENVNLDSSSWSFQHSHPLSKGFVIQWNLEYNEVLGITSDILVDPLNPDITELRWANIFCHSLGPSLNRTIARFSHKNKQATKSSVIEHNVLNGSPNVLDDYNISLGCAALFYEILILSQTKICHFWSCRCPI